jgi:hypothetical protein
MESMLDDKVSQFFHGDWNLLPCTELKVLQQYNW